MCKYENSIYTAQTRPTDPYDATLFLDKLLDKLVEINENSSLAVKVYLVEAYAKPQPDLTHKIIIRFHATDVDFVERELRKLEKELS